MKKEFFPTVAIVGKQLIFNAEAIETMDLDTEEAKVILIETTDEQKKKFPKEILIVKTNGSLCDDLEDIKDVFPPENIRLVKIESKDGEIVEGSIDLSKEVISSVHSVFSSKEKNENEFKLLVCNIESPLGKEFREQFDIKGNYYRLVNMDDKRNSVGKEKDVKKEIEERISIN